MSFWKLAAGTLLFGLGSMIAVLAIMTQPPEGSPPSLPEQTGGQSAPAPSSDEAVASVEPDDDDDEAERWQGQLAGELARVADVYEQTSRFPPYSIPISSDNVDDYRYNTYSTVEIPFSDGNGEARIRVRLERLHFEKGEPIVGVAQVSGSASSALELDRVTLRDHSNEVLYSQGLESANESGEYDILLRPSQTRSADWPGELMLMVSGEFRDRKVDAVAPLRYEEPVGEIDSVGSAFIEGAHLVIPVEADLHEEGYYGISGNLYSESGTPLVHLEHQATLSRLDNSTRLKVHREALVAKDDEGPYYLSDLVIRKLPARPGDRTRFGPEVTDEFSVSGFPFRRYEDTPYEDPLREARLEFLRSAGQH